VWVVDIADDAKDIVGSRVADGTLMEIPLVYTSWDHNEKQVGFETVELEFDHEWYYYCSSMNHVNGEIHVNWNVDD